MVNPSSSQPVGAERRLQDLGMVLPIAPYPLEAYVEAVQSGSLLFLSGTHRSFSGIYLDKTVGSVFGVASLPLRPPVTQR